MRPEKSVIDQLPQLGFPGQPHRLPKGERQEGKKAAGRRGGRGGRWRAGEVCWLAGLLAGLFHSQIILLVWVIPVDLGWQG